MDMYTAVFSITNKDLLYSTWNSAPVLCPAWKGEEGFEENGYMHAHDRHTCMLTIY